MTEFSLGLGADSGASIRDGAGMGTPTWKFGVGPAAMMGRRAAEPG